MSVFGFTIKPPGSGGGDWLPTIRYDARAGRMFRMDRVVDSSGNYDNEKVDITKSFKALFDAENVYVGWIDFTPGQAPSLVLVPRDSKDHPFPPQPDTNHKQGVRIVLKLAADCAQGQPAVREIAGTSAALLGALEKIVGQYDKEKAANPGKLPVIMLDGDPMPVESSNGKLKSTNYHPVFKIVGWAPRGDFTFVPPDASTRKPAGNAHAGNGAAPATGAQRVSAPPAQPAAPQSDFASDFG